MKTSLDPRHKNRESAIKELFAWDFQKKSPPNNKIAQKVVKKQKKIDKIITTCAPEWPVGQINQIDLAILRLAIFELSILPKEPPKVIIDEAIELAKAYGGEKSPGFINGVLATVLKNHWGKNGKPTKKAKN